ncbi:MAG TPA: alpha/beta hydrolase domain-containing protein [Sphingopyxis sp.]|nr:alpha/beta hydrolase domain-containing protein [Sphingopyxis sp.]HMP46262.1 alpha/beta hydrolase domain-containing protein [Sphingopyxis sp.]HMQ18027.1 alpha/beta hydrolase domain-containing protein [Sphingopyxis sp.]
MSRRDFAAAALAGAALGGMGAPLRAASPSPALRPIPAAGRGRIFGTTLDDLAALGYVEEEVLLAGEAARYDPVGALGPDGRWTLAPGERRPFVTRLIVRRPADPAKFNGTLIVEWLNVSLGFDVSFADGPGSYDGFAWVGVTAQYGGAVGDEAQPQGLKAWDAARYAALVHPGDDWSYDIFTQAARALRANAAAGHPLHGLTVRKLIGTGVSQSGSRILSYANGVQPLARAYDALMPMLCAGAAAEFDGGAAPGVAAARGRPRFAHVRADLGIPAMQLNTEFEAPFFRAIRQPDSDLYRSWEVAGASHGPTELLRAIHAKEQRDGVGSRWHAFDAASDVAWQPTADAAIAHFHRWLNGGPPPPVQAPIAFEVDGRTIARDAHGNAKGGVRLPELEVPVASYRGQGTKHLLAGETHPFAPDELRRLYPDHPSYVAQVATAAKAAVAAGVILPARERFYVARAEAAAIPPARS